jgi:carboxypeptidase C (cathepsin A)
VFLNQEDRERLSFTYYPSGHMIYMHHPSLEQFRKDAEAWYNK